MPQPARPALSRPFADRGWGGTEAAAEAAVEVGDVREAALEWDRADALFIEAGLANGSDATVRMGTTTVTGNTNGLAMANGGRISSFGDNSVNGNSTSDGTPLPPMLAKE